MQQTFMLTQVICIRLVLTELRRSQKFPWGMGGMTDLGRWGEGKADFWEMARRALGGPPKKRGPNGAPVCILICICLFLKDKVQYRLEG